MSTNQTLSVVIPVLNAERYIKETLLSLLAQSSPPEEIIIIDGGSTDKSIDIIKSVETRNMQLIKEPGLNLPLSINKGFSHSTTSILCWLNADDIFYNRLVIERVKARFSQYDFTSRFLYGNTFLINEKSIIIGLLAANIIDSGDPILGKNIFTGSLFFNTVAWSDFGGFSGLNLLSFEYELINFLVSKSKPSFMNRYLGCFRLHDSSLSHINSSKMLSECIEMGLPPISNELLYARWALKRAFANIAWGKYSLNRLQIGTAPDILRNTT
jgi:glycosyltransferase involved in cell wall biosynthesis